MPESRFSLPSRPHVDEQLQISSGDDLEIWERVKGHLAGLVDYLDAHGTSRTVLLQEATERLHGRVTSVVRLDTPYLAPTEVGAVYGNNNQASLLALIGTGDHVLGVFNYGLLGRHHKVQQDRIRLVPFVATESLNGVLPMFNSAVDLPPDVPVPLEPITGELTTASVTFNIGNGAVVIDYAASEDVLVLGHQSQSALAA